MVDKLILEPKQDIIIYLKMHHVQQILMKNSI